MYRVRITGWPANIAWQVTTDKDRKTKQKHCSETYVYDPTKVAAYCERKSLPVAAEEHQGVGARDSNRLLPVYSRRWQ